MEVVEVAKHVREAMTEDVLTVDASQTIEEAAALMSAEDVGSLPVVGENGRLVGILTDRDIVVRAVARGEDVHSVRVDAIASHDVVTVRPDDDLDQALDWMARHQVRRLPVVDNGHLAGMVTQADVASEAKAKAVGEMLADISLPTSET
jgi:CBS domain-containing protein